MGFCEILKNRIFGFFYFDKSLKIKEKESFYWLSLLNVPFGAEWYAYRTFTKSVDGIFALLEGK